MWPEEMPELNLLAEGIFRSFNPVRRRDARVEFLAIRNMHEEISKSSIPREMEGNRCMYR